MPQFRSLIENKANRRLQDAAALGTCEPEMDIACPNCAATYRVPDSLLAGGKALRCAACDHEWVPEVAIAPPFAAPAQEANFVVEAVPAPSSPAEPTPLEPDLAASTMERATELPSSARATPPTEPPPLQRRPGPKAAEMRPPVTRPPVKRRIARGLPIAWLASVAVVLLGLLGLVVFGDEIALAWPPFARVTLLLNG